MPYNKNPDKSSKRYQRWSKHYAKYREKYLATTRAYNARVKKQVYDHYGGRCVCCGESRYEFLALDHIDGGGDSERKKLGLYGTPYFAWVIKNNYPDHLQLLCHNCNMAKGLYGYCPHTKEPGHQFIKPPVKKNGSLDEYNRV